MTTTAGATEVRRERARSLTPVRAWLHVIALLITAMIVVGGATRLTDSGLSITEWRPIHGTIPPLNAAEWQEEFERYQQIPQYELVNKGMTVEEFKTIFWWEWAHRFLGRFIGLAFFVPLVWFWATGRIGRALAPQLLGIFVLGGLQGAIGWWMVASGLVARTDVSQYRLATHLTIAFGILALVVWVARGLSPRRAPAGPDMGRAFAIALVALLFLQVFLGGLVAGLDAGYVSSTWPTMDGAFVPDGLLVVEPWWRNIFENPLTAQFDHRMVAYLILAVALVYAVAARGTNAARGALVLLLVFVVQAALGIMAVVMEMPLHVALTHQFVGAMAMWVAVAHLRTLSLARHPAVALQPA
ncbi:MAG: COX15/CtaA family protein [Rhizobiales bacterium]|nr:COX15/CtaA family protein [Hyphomicrobiales bacterium]